MPSPRRLSAVVMLAPLLVAAGAMVAAAPAAGDEVSAAEAPVVEVGAGGDPQYAPADVTVEPGQDVRFVWADDGHSVTADDGAFDTHPDCRELNLLPTEWQCGDEGDEEVVTLDEPGTYTYSCRVHDDMTGTITVEEASEEPDEPDDPEDGDAGDGDGSEDPDEPEDGDEGDAGGDPDGSDGDPSGGDEPAGSGEGSGGADDGEGADDQGTSDDEVSSSGSGDDSDAERQAAADALSDFEPEQSDPGGIGEAPVPDADLEEPEPAEGLDGLAEPEVDEPDASGYEWHDPRGGYESEEPELEPFPEAEEPSSDDEVALPAQDDRDRTVPIAVAAVGVIGAGAAVVRQVMVGA